VSTYAPRWSKATATVSPASAPLSPLKLPPEPVPVEVAPPVARPARPSPQARLAALAGEPGHCGTCRHFTPDPEGGPIGVCGLGRGAFEPWARHSRLSVEIHVAAACMTHGAPRWAALQHADRRS